MDKKRSIDNQRNSAIRMEVGTPDDRSAITDMLTIGGSLYVIKETGIYKIKLADGIDPERTNPAVPNTQQQVLAYGSDSELVGRTFLTAVKLFNGFYLSKSIDHEQALVLAFDGLKDIAYMQDGATAFLKAESDAAAAFEGQRRKDGSVAMPAIPDVIAYHKSFVQKADHALQSLLKIVKVFYGEKAGEKWFESFANDAEKRYGHDDSLSSFLQQALPFLKFIRNTRNCVEHPSPPHRTVITDFCITPDAKILSPTIEVIHPETSQPPIALSAFMVQIIDQVISVFELMIVMICDKNVNSSSGFHFQVVELPEEQRRQKHVRYSYAMELNGQIVPAG